MPTPEIPGECPSDRGIREALALMWGLDNARAILDQNPTATFVLTWPQWDAIGRRVRHDAAGNGMKVINRDVTKLLTVWDITQTDPKE